MTTSYQANYDAEYYAHACGAPYEHNDAWMGFFNLIAEQIVERLHPHSVIDAGCAMGFLVEALRQRGVEAWGIDISEYAIQKVLPEFQPYCKVGLITEPFLHPKYDLIVCIEVLEHLSPEDGLLAIQNMCSHTEDILFSSTPSDFSERTHVNVQRPEYWASLFSRFDFIHDLDFDASFITPWAMRFLKSQPSKEKRLAQYEGKIWQLTEEISRIQSLKSESEKELEQKEAALQAELSAIRNSKSWRIMSTLGRIKDLIIHWVTSGNQ